MSGDSKQPTWVLILAAVIGAVGAMAVCAVPIVDRLADIYLPATTPTSPVVQTPSSAPLNETPPASPVMPTTTPIPQTSFTQLATRRCQEFQGSPVLRSEISTEQVNVWRQIGKTDNAEVARITYCEIHQVPGMVGFVEGDMIPANVIITADLGFNWKSTYPDALERLVHAGGGWGVFLSLRPFVVQHASDLQNDVGGQYWFISE
jgi:hypothetical protein